MNFARYCTLKMVRTVLYLVLYEKNESEDAAANTSPRPKSESTVLSVSLPPSEETLYHQLRQTKQQLVSHVSSPEFSSFTRDDIVLVMESAAISRSFLRFLLGPSKTYSRGQPPGHCGLNIQNVKRQLWYPERRPPGHPRLRP